MRDYLQRFKSMVDELMGHPRVRVTHLWMGAGVSEGEIARVEAGLGHALDESIKDFYRQTDGMQLRWVDRENPYYVPKRDDRMGFERLPLLEHDHPHADGLINILPFAEALLDYDYAGELYDDDEDEDDDDDDDGVGESSERVGDRSGSVLAFRRGLRPVDNFSPYYRAAWFLSGAEPNPNPPILTGQDHDACYSDSKRLDFRAYMELVLQCRGHLDRRLDTLLGEGAPGEVSVARGAPVAIESLLPRAARVGREGAVGARVSLSWSRYQGCVRGTVLSVHDAREVPRDWAFVSELYRVRLDLGVEVYVPSPRVRAVTEVDNYERAVADPRAFFAELNRQNPAACQTRLGPLLTEAGGSSRFRGSTLGIVHGSWRAYAMVRGLPPAEAVAALLQLLEVLSADGGTHERAREILGAPFDPTQPRRTRPASPRELTGLLACALAIVVRRTYEARPFAQFSDGFGWVTAARLRALLTRLAALGHERGHDHRRGPLTYLRASLDAAPGPILLSDAGPDGRALGLTRLPVVVD